MPLLGQNNGNEGIKRLLGGVAAAASRAPASYDFEGRLINSLNSSEARRNEQNKKEREAAKQQQARDFMREVMRLNDKDPKTAARSLQEAANKFNLLTPDDEFKIIQAVRKGRQAVNDYNFSLEEQAQKRKGWEREGVLQGREDTAYQHGMERQPIEEGLSDRERNARIAALNRQGQPTERQPQLGDYEKIMLKSYIDDRKELQDMLRYGIEDPKSGQMVMPNAAQTADIERQISELDDEINRLNPNYKPSGQVAVTSRGDVESRLGINDQDRAATIPDTMASSHGDYPKMVGEANGYTIGKKGRIFYVKSDGDWKRPKTFKERAAVREYLRTAPKAPTAPKKETPPVSGAGFRSRGEAEQNLTEFQKRMSQMSGR